MKKTKMTNKYLEKIATLQTLTDAVFKDSSFDLHKAKINLAKKLKDRLGEGIHRQFKRLKQ